VGIGESCRAVELRLAWWYFGEVVVSTAVSLFKRRLILSDVSACCVCDAAILSSFFEAPDGYFCGGY
jgi:hypothetical protein